MSEENENVTHQIKSFREMDYRQLDDCASFLGISDERYRNIEENEHLVTLPEMELLSILFQTPITTFLKGDSIEDVDSPFNSSRVRKEYKKLRNKMILAKIEIACQKKNISIQELLEKVNLSVNAVESYEDGIPRDHLLFICNELSLSIETLLEGAVNSVESPKAAVRDEHREPEFTPEPPEPDTPVWDDNNFDDLVSAIKRAPKDEQALLARILLQELKEF